MNNKITKYNDDIFSSNWLKNFFDLPIVSNGSVLKTNIRKEGNNYVYEVDVPGYNKEDVIVNYEDGYLIVEAKSTKEYSSNSSNSYVRQERYSGSCSRSYYIGEIDENKIIAKYNNGVLSISFPDDGNNKKTKVKQINIQ